VSDASPALASTTGSIEHAAILRILAGIVLAMFLGALDQTIVATALPTIGHDLGNFDNLPWVVTAYLISSTAVTPLYGKLSDIHGRRAMLLASLALFVLGSVACAVAPTMLALILARGLQGVGGGGLISLAQTVIADVVAPKERARYQGLIASVFVASSVIGPVLGGVFAEKLHWSLIFWINLPAGIGRATADRSRAACAAAPRSAPPARPDRRGVDPGRHHLLPPGAQLGRRTLFLGLAAAAGIAWRHGGAVAVIRRAARHRPRAVTPNLGAA
jgi:MFS family permease